MEQQHTGVRVYKTRGAERSSVGIRIMLTPDEREQLRRMCAAAGTTLSDMVRVRMFGAAANGRNDDNEETNLYV